MAVRPPVILVALFGIILLGIGTNWVNLPSTSVQVDLLSKGIQEIKTSLRKENLQDKAIKDSVNALAGQQKMILAQLREISEAQKKFKLAKRSVLRGEGRAEIAQIGDLESAVATTTTEARQTSKKPSMSLEADLKKNPPTINAASVDASTAEPPGPQRQLKRQRMLQESMRALHQVYKKYAWTYDEYKPMSHRGHHFINTPAAVSLGLTPTETLGTAWIMGLKEIYNECADYMTGLSMAAPATTNVFEANIRMVGGLVSGYQLGQRSKPGLIEKAVDLGDRLLKAFGPNNLPTRDIHLAEGYGVGDEIVIAIPGTLQVEWNTLTEESSQKRFEKMAMKQYDNFFGKATKKFRENPTGLIPNDGSAQSNTWWGTISIGAGSDSYYEYLAKVPVLNSKYKHVQEYFRSEMTKVLKHLWHRSPAGYWIIGRYSSGQVDNFWEHYECYAAGMFALASVEFGKNHNVIQDTAVSPNDESEKDLWMRVATELTETCHRMQNITASGIPPEFVYLDGSEMRVGMTSYFLRPEVVEAYFYMYRATKKEKYRQWSWDLFSALVKFNRMEDGGFTELHDVTRNPPPQRDGQPSFFVSETLKYLYMIQQDPGDEGYISLNDWVMSTEGHPMKRVTPSDKWD